MQKRSLDRIEIRERFSPRICRYSSGRTRSRRANARRGRRSAGAVEFPREFVTLLTTNETQPKTYARARTVVGRWRTARRKRDGENTSHCGYRPDNAVLAESNCPVELVLRSLLLLEARCASEFRELSLSRPYTRQIVPRFNDRGTANSIAEKRRASNPSPPPASYLPLAHRRFDRSR